MGQWGTPQLLFSSNRGDFEEERRLSDEANEEKTTKPHHNIREININERGRREGHREARRGVVTRRAVTRRIMASSASGRCSVLLEPLYSFHFK